MTRAIEESAELAGEQPQDDVRVMLDPESHPFCLFRDDRLLTGVVHHFGLPAFGRPSTDVFAVRAAPSTGVD